MDLREYDYFYRRPDTFSEGALKAIQKVLSGIGSDSAPLIDKILKDGYIEPPLGYEGRVIYKVNLSKPEIETVFRELIRAEGMAGTDTLQEQKALERLKCYIGCWSKVLHEVPETYEEHKSKQAYYDLRGISFDAFLDLIFDHPVADEAKKKKAWYWQQDDWIELDRAEVVGLYVELFSRSDELLGRYPKDKLEQGCWFMMSRSLDFSVDELIHDDELDIALKEKLVNSMYSLYEKFFFDEPLETSSYMWWDNFSHDYCVPGLRDPINDEEDKRIQDAMFSTLVKVLSLESEICQGAALHGLGHLRHPGTEEVITDFLKRNRHLNAEQIAYAKQCITGDIM